MDGERGDGGMEETEGTVGTEGAVGTASRCRLRGRRPRQRLTDSQERNQVRIWTRLESCRVLALSSSSHCPELVSSKDLK